MKYIIALMVITVSWVTEPCELQKKDPFYGCTVSHPKKLVTDTSLVFILSDSATKVPKDKVHSDGGSVKYNVLKIDTLKLSRPIHNK